MKVGLIARADSRGIAYQTWEFYKAMQPAKTLVVQMRDPHYPDDPGRFRGKGVTFVQSDLRTRALPETKVRDFLAGLDVVFAVETVYDWRLIHWARSCGVKVVIQGNPELTRHHSHPELPHPDLWAWPTDWLINDARIPRGEVVPVPCVERPEAAPPDPYSGPLRVLHPAGKAAIGDRNGTVTFLESLKSIREKVHVTIVTQDPSLPMPFRHGTNVTTEVILNGYVDRWDMYRDQHVSMIPRRYGGLCLPALESLASGMVVVMPDCSPNSMWPGPRLTARKGRLQRTPLGATPTYAVHPMDIAHTIDQLAANREALAVEMEIAAEWAADNCWSELKPRIYDPLFERLTR